MFPFYIRQRKEQTNKQNVLPGKNHQIIPKQSKVLKVCLSLLLQLTQNGFVTYCVLDDFFKCNKE